VIETLRALAVLLEPPGPEHAAIARALELPAVAGPDEHTAMLVFQAYPYASVYLGAEGMLGGDARDRVAGFWRALGGEAPPEPDHLSILLAGLAALAGEAHTVRAALFWEHVASWMPPYLATLLRIGGRFHAAWAELVGRVVVELATELGPPVRVPLALRSAPELPAEPAGIEELLTLLLVPARTGIVLVRDDLERAAMDLDLALRVAERKFALRALLAQSPAAVLDWLAREARAQAESLLPLGPVTAWWAARARATASWLDALSATARADRSPADGDLAAR
jgi:Nitrate reductase delta subunit